MRRIRALPRGGSRGDGWPDDVTWGDVTWGDVDCSDVRDGVGHARLVVMRARRRASGALHHALLLAFTMMEVLGLSAVALAQGPRPDLPDLPDVHRGAIDDITHRALRGFALVEAWRIDEARPIAEELHAHHRDHPMTSALLAEIKLHMSDYAGAVESYRRAEVDGVPKQLLGEAPLAAAANVETSGYRETVGDYVIVRHRPGKDQVIVEAAIETFERARHRMGELFGFVPNSRVVLELYPTAGTLAAVSTLTREEIQNSGTIALCRWNRLMVTTPRAVMFGYAWRDTIAHELAHLIIGGASKNRAPIWLHEGLAKFAETAWRGEPGLGLSEEQQLALKDAARKGTLIPFEKMHPSMAKLKSQEETSLAFAEVFTFIEYLVALKGWEGVRDLLTRLSEGASEEVSVRAVYGQPLDALFRQWSRGVKDRPIRRPDGEVKGSREVIVKDRPDTPDDNLHGVGKLGRRHARAADLLYARGRLKAAQVELEKAFQATNSPLVSAKLATVALATGDLASAERAARAAIAGTQEFAGPHVTLAEILLRNGKPKDAIQALDHAIGVNPFDPRIYSLISTARRTLGQTREAEEAARTLSLLMDPPVDGGSSPLGVGGAIEIDAIPFSRVFVRPKGVLGEWIATGAVTPTARISLRSGEYELMLVPPSGSPLVRALTVEARSDESAAQRIVLELTGS